MEKKVRIAHWFFMICMILFIITLAITPVGGWCDSNPYHSYYMTAFVVTSAWTLVSILICFRIEK
jgi:hypothetical protein